MNRTFDDSMSINNVSPRNQPTTLSRLAKSNDKSPSDGGATGASGGGLIKLDKHRLEELLHSPTAHSSNRHHRDTTTSGVTKKMLFDPSNPDKPIYVDVKMEKSNEFNSKKCHDYKKLIIKLFKFKSFKSKF